MVHQEEMLPKWIGGASVCTIISDEAADVLKKKTSEAEMIKKSFAVYTSAAAAVQKQTDQLQRIHKERGQSIKYACVRERGVYNFTASYYQEPHILKQHEARAREE